MKIAKTNILTKIAIVILIILVGVLIIRIVRIYLADKISINELGDAVGGIGGPIIALIGTLIVYISFQEQVKANELQSKSILESLKNTKEDRIFNGLLMVVENRILFIQSQTYVFKDIKEKLTFKEVIVKIRDFFKSYSDIFVFKFDKEHLLQSDEYRLFNYFEYYHRNLFRIIERTMVQKSVERNLLINLIWESFSPMYDSVIESVYSILLNKKEEERSAFESEYIKKVFWWNAYFIGCLSEEVENSLSMEVTLGMNKVYDEILKRKNEETS